MTPKANSMIKDFMLAVRIPSELHRLAKIDSVTRGVTLQDIIADLLAKEYCHDVKDGNLAPVSKASAVSRNSI